MPDVTVLAEAALERIQRLMARWPRPAAGQGVRADAVLAGLAPLAPLAAMVLKLPEGYSKGYYQGAGYLSGTSRITTADYKVARAVEQDVNVILPAAGERPLTRQLYNQIKEHAYKLLGLATDLDVTQGQLSKVGTSAHAAWDRWVSMPPVVNVGASVPGGTVAAKAEAALQRVLRFSRAWPKPGPEQMVKTQAVVAALLPLRPLAEKIAGLPVGTKKGTIAGSSAPEALAAVFSPLYLIAEAIEGRAQPATGYLSGSDSITQNDRNTARFILVVLDNLEQHPVPYVVPVLYDTLHKQTHRLLMIATDLDIDTTLADKASLALESAKDAVEDFKKAAKRGSEEGWSVLKIALAGLGIGAGAVVVSSVLRK